MTAEAPASGSSKAVAAARAFLSQGRIDDAERLLDDVLAAEPGQVEALALRASTFLVRGQKDHANLILSELATQFPDRADIIADLGVAHQAEERAEEARFCFERAIQLQPEEGRHRISLIGVLLKLEDVAGAKEQLARLFDLVQRQGNSELQAEAHALAGHIAVLEGAFFSAEAAFRQAVTLRPRHQRDLVELSDVTARLGRRDEALKLAQDAYLLAPTDLEVATKLACRLMESHRLDEAERHLRRIMATAPNHVEANNLLAALLIARGETAKALAQFAGVVRRSSDNPDVILRMANLVRASGDLEKALTFVDLALKQAPRMAVAMALREDILLALGRISEVWPANPEGEEPAPPPAVTVPLALPVAEVMLFSRFVRRLAPEGGRVLCHAEPDLQPLLVGISGIITTTEPAGPQAVPVTLLPALFGTGEDLAASPYLAVEETRHARWTEATAHLPRPLIGLSWDEAAPGLTLDALVAALKEGLEGQGTLLSLAFDQRRGQLPAHPDIVDAGVHFSDAGEMIAAIAQLDLTVGTDGVALHVAGALGRQAFIAVPAHQPWFWAAQDGRSLWYPSVRVARQPATGSWNSTLAELTAAARALVEPAGEEP